MLRLALCQYMYIFIYKHYDLIIVINVLHRRDSYILLVLYFLGAVVVLIVR